MKIHRLVSLSSGIDILRLDKTVASPGTIASGLTPYAVDASGFDVKDNAASYPPWIPSMVITGLECAFALWEAL